MPVRITKRYMYSGAPALSEHLTAGFLGEAEGHIAVRQNGLPCPSHPSHYERRPYVNPTPRKALCIYPYTVTFKGMKFSWRSGSTSFCFILQSNKTSCMMPTNLRLACWSTNTDARGLLHRALRRFCAYTFKLSHLSGKDPHDSLLQRGFLRRQHEWQKHEKCK